jgi:hypothetical protein
MMCDCGSPPDSIIQTGDNGWVCGDCGLVQDPDCYDTGPEWRSHDASTRNRIGLKVRVGEMLDHHYSTSIHINRETKDMKSAQTLKQKHKTLNGRHRAIPCQKDGLRFLRNCFESLSLPQNVMKDAETYLKEILAMYFVTRIRPTINDDFWVAVVYYISYLIHSPFLYDDLLSLYNSVRKRSVNMILRRIFEMIHGQIDNHQIASDIKLSFDPSPCSSPSSSSSSASPSSCSSSTDVRYVVHHLMIRTPVTDMVKHLIFDFDLVPCSIRSTVKQYCSVLLSHSDLDLTVATKKEDLYSFCERRSVACVRIAMNDILRAQHLRNISSASNGCLNMRMTKDYQNGLTKLTHMSKLFHKSPTTISNEESDIRALLEGRRDEMKRSTGKRKRTRTTTKTTPTLVLSSGDQKRLKRSKVKMEGEVLMKLPSIDELPSAFDVLINNKH